MRGSRSLGTGVRETEGGESPETKRSDGPRTQAFWAHSKAGQAPTSDCLCGFQVGPRRPGILENYE